MAIKYLIKPTKAKIIFILSYFVLYIVLTLSFPLYYGLATDVPKSYGFPFVYKIQGSYFSTTPNYTNQFYPFLLILDILIPVAIYILIGVISQKKSKKH